MDVTVTKKRKYARELVVDYEETPVKKTKDDDSENSENGRSDYDDDPGCVYGRAENGGGCCVS